MIRNEDVAILRAVAERVRTHHEESAAQENGPEAGRYTGVAMSDVDGQLACNVYGIPACHSHIDAKDRILNTHLGYGRPFPHSVLVYGACQVEGCTCQGKLGFAQFIMAPSGKA